MGYSTKSNCTPKVAAETQDQIRARLQQTAGYRLDDSAQFYHKISKSKANKVSVDSKIRARQRLDTLLGHDAPAKMEVTQQHNISAAIGVISQLCVDPVSLQNALNQRINTPELIPNVDTNTSQDCKLLSHNNIQNNALDIQSDGSDSSTVQVDCATDLNGQDSNKKVLAEKKEGGGGVNLWGRVTIHV